MGGLDEVLSVTWADGAARGPSAVGAVGVAHGHLGEGRLIGPAINGGVLMAIGASAASSGPAAVGHPDVLTWGAPGWPPTMELTGQLLGRPAPGWLLVEMTTDSVVGDLAIGDVCVWDFTGRWWRGRGSSPGCACPATSLLGCPKRARPSMP